MYHKRPFLRQIALVETDLATIARADDALKRLDACIWTLCYKRRATEELIETLRGAYHDLLLAIAVAKGYISQQRMESEKW